MLIDHPDPTEYIMHAWNNEPSEKDIKDVAINNDMCTELYIAYDTW